MQIDLIPKRWLLAGVAQGGRGAPGILFGLAVLVGLPVGWTDTSNQAFAQAPKRFDGASECMGCHTQPTATRTPSVSFSTLSEYGIWKTLDKHAQAYAVLSNKRSQRMGELLGKDPKYVLQPEAGCLNCHAMNTIGNKPTKGLKVADGVNCGGCHGPSEKWFGEHIRPKWRKLSPDEKSKMGMFDIRNPVRRAELCASCHVGNAAEGKVVTHAMFAAGHPPLPPFELALFSKNEPKHWREPADVPYFKVLDALTRLPGEPRDAKPSVKAILQRYWKTEVEDEWVNEVVNLYPTRAEARKVLNQYPYKKADTFQTRLALIGSVVSLRSTLQLVVDRADPDNKANKASVLWPELLWDKKGEIKDADIRSEVKERWGEIAMTHSDCYACHHDLRYPGYRQYRGYGFRIPSASGKGKRIATVPGRPLLRSWPFALLEPQVQIAANGNRVQFTSELEKDIRGLARVLDQRPFGKPEPTAAACKDLIAWCSKLLKLLETKEITTNEVRKLLKTLCTMDAIAYADYENARQIASVLAIASQEVGSQLTPDQAARVRQGLAKLEDQLHLYPYRDRTERQKLVRDIILDQTTVRANDFDAFLKAVNNLDEMKVVLSLRRNNFLNAVYADISNAKLNRLLRTVVVDMLEAVNNRELNLFLRRVYDYDPKEFMKTMAEIGTALP